MRAPLDREGSPTQMRCCSPSCSLVYLATRDYPRAIRFVERSLCISRRIGDRVAEMGDINSMGLVHLNAGAPHKAVECFDEMLMIAREIQEPATSSNRHFWMPNGDWEA